MTAKNHAPVQFQLVKKSRANETEWFERKEIRYVVSLGIRNGVEDRQ